MIKITIPNNNINERKYIIGVIFNEFLGLDYKIVACDFGSAVSDWAIELENRNKLIIEDHFFNKYPKTKNYLKFKNIPTNINYQLKTENKFIVEVNIPVIFGSASTFKLQPSRIICSIDIFASIFFMLTRWEEYVNKERDIHNRFPAYASTAYKNDFLHRPVVNEYIEMLWNMLLFLGIEQKRKEKKYELTLTHDVDNICFWKNKNQLFRLIAGDVLKRKNVSLALERLSEYYLVKRKTIKDPFDTFEWIMDKSESIGLKSRFYFMSGGITSYDNRYRIDDKKTIGIINKIKKRGHIIGLHGSYDSYNNLEQFKKEKDLLEKIVENPILEGRQHYLRFEAPITWQVWEDAGMEIDLTCGYADKEGFRCGTGDEFSVFNILMRKKLKLKERPLVVMDCSLFDYNSYDYNEAMKEINTMKKNTNSFTMLWHNSYIKHIKFYGEYIGSKK
jgi:hypothetical protein